MNNKRRPLIAGNWKMQHGGPTGVDLAIQCIEKKRGLPGVDLVVSPPFTALAAVAGECEEGNVGVAGQNLYAKDSGAYTGEISGTMLKDAGCTWVILGHSERRQLFGETDALVAEKVKYALSIGLLPIACVGETLQEREAGHTLDVVKRQVMAFLPMLAGSNASCAIAYEPIWAIGTGKTAGPAEAEEVHAAIREWLAASSPALAERTRILYGGSVKADNANALLGCANVDGALVGGASLDADSFGAIGLAAEGLSKKLAS